MSGTRTRDRSAEAFEARIRAVRRRSRWRRAALVLVPGVLAALVWLVLASPLTRVDDVVVVGVTGPRAAEVASRAGEGLGGSLALVDTDAVGAQVSRLSYVDAVVVRRAWPRRLRVEVTPRTAVAALPRPGGGVQLVDAEAVVFADAPRAPAGLPLVQVDVGQAGGAGLRATLDVIAGLPPDLRRQATGFSATSPDDVRFRLGARTVLWGGADDGELKAEVLRALLPRAARTVDVSAPRAPVTR